MLPASQRSVQCFSQPQINIFIVIPSTIITATTFHFEGLEEAVWEDGEMGKEEREQRLAAERLKRICRHAGRWKKTKKRWSPEEKKKLWFKLEWKSYDYWILYLLCLISISSITRQPGLVNSSHMTEREVVCLLDRTVLNSHLVFLLIQATWKKQFWENCTM